jgi:hypothetical protein
MDAKCPTCVKPTYDCGNVNQYYAYHADAPLDTITKGQTKMAALETRLSIQ